MGKGKEKGKEKGKGKEESLRKVRSTEGRTDTQMILYLDRQLNEGAPPG